MKHVRMIALAGAMATCTLTACTNASQTSSAGAVPKGASGSNATQPAAAQTKSDPAVSALVPKEYATKGSISVAMDASYPPFQMFAADNKTIVGFDADFATAVAAKMGLKANLVNVGFDTILTGLSAGRYDLGESSFSVTPERQKVVDFVQYLQGGAGIAVAPGNPLGLKMDPMTLCGHKIAAQKGTTQAISELPGIADQCKTAGKPALEPVLFPSQNDAVLALASGRVDGMMADSTAVSYQGKLSGNKFVLAPGDIYEPAPTGIAMAKGSSLKAAVSAAVKALYADGTVQALSAKWSIPTSNLSPTPGA